MRQNELKSPPGAKRSRKRLGRGDSSGHGSFSGRGMKGQRSRSGHGIRPGFEGGQNPLVKALPSIRGFTNIFRTHYHLVNLDRLAKFPADSHVSLTTMLEAGIVKDLKRPVKVLGRGELSSPLVVEAHRFSASARSKIEAAGGRVMEIS